MDEAILGIVQFLIDAPGGQPAAYPMLRQYITPEKYPRFEISDRAGQVLRPIADLRRDESEADNGSQQRLSRLGRLRDGLQA